ncbi:hypothetical protein HS088_TW14G00748 [Tripterygium wilfordii]|uniref:ARM repeat superfamily protein n=1 Tax=Tripterygium wilfordii TaxID=458696 RepID=A0A7J7CR68_TRIWF|nr:uncharacterized protein At2g39910 [Tripterygium wilfordii]KAF5736603.1 hypothetical protein HS088_TW14G00748 [Tripterygium wilfordii]
MSSFSALHERLVQLKEPILDSLARTNYTPPESTNVSVKSTLDSLLSGKIPNPKSDIPEHQLFTSITNFSLACALLASSQSSGHELLSWIPKNLSILAENAFDELSRAYVGVLGERNEKKIGDLGLECELISVEKRLVVELMPEVFPLLKERIKESSIDKSDEGDHFSAASAKAPVGYAVLAAYQFRWFVTQVEYPHLGKLCALVIPCALTTLDHWSPEVKGQGMISFTHLAKNVNSAELGWYEDVILDACCQNIACSDEIWHHVVEMSVLLVTSIQRNDPRSSWFERIVNEMLGHLERQPRNKERRVIWLRYVEPLLNGLGLVLLAHFRRFFPLFIKWMHDDDDETVLLVLKRMNALFRLTWIRNTPFIERVVDELAVLYKEAAMRRAREDIRVAVLQILTLLQQCKGKQFEAAWDKHRDDLDLMNLSLHLSIKE